MLDYEKGEVRFTTLVSELYSLDLGDYMKSLGNEQTSLIPNDLNRVLWKNVLYAIGHDVTVAPQA
ncbi:hypothetical protein PSCICO_02870 [Pseudomonas cichorii]|uniref:hypothetical protein n=1 Tax=Pseudomonas cichorii TaxID=36746 RepID=UPI0019103BF8|nr:hypothetical protein [Pseudomonas cichorii]GFM84888.1 hypothetical protein PSCICO_02870 [Pseudomonas cichorii]